MIEEGLNIDFQAIFKSVGEQVVLDLIFNYVVLNH